MKMRLKPIRGSRAIYLPTNQEVVLLDVVEQNMVKAIFPNDKIQAVPKAELNLHVIDTRSYEKIVDAAS